MSIHLTLYCKWFQTKPSTKLKVLGSIPEFSCQTNDFQPGCPQWKKHLPGNIDLYSPFPGFPRERFIPTSLTGGGGDPHSSLLLKNGFWNAKKHKVVGIGLTQQISYGIALPIDTWTSASKFWLWQWPRSIIERAYSHWQFTEGLCLFPWKYSTFNAHVESVHRD